MADRNDFIELMRENITKQWGRAAWERMSKKMKGGKCDRCFQNDSSGYCFPCNLGLCARCNKSHLREHGVE